MFWPSRCLCSAFRLTVQISELIESQSTSVVVTFISYIKHIPLAHVVFVTSNPSIQLGNV